MNPVNFLCVFNGCKSSIHVSLTWLYWVWSISTYCNWLWKRWEKIRCNIFLDENVINYRICLNEKLWWFQTRNKPMISVNICFSIFFSRPLDFPSMLENNVIAWMLNYVNSLGCHFKNDSKYQLSAFTDHHAHHVVTNQTFTFFFSFFLTFKRNKIDVK